MSKKPHAWLAAVLAGGIAVVPGCGGGSNQHQAGETIPDRLLTQQQVQEQRDQIQSGENRRQILQLRNRSPRGNVPDETSRFQVLQTDTASSVTLPYMNRNGTQYVSITQLSQVLEFHTKFDEDKRILRIGDYGVEFEFYIDSNTVYREGEKRELSHPSIVLNGAVYTPAEAAVEMFGADMNFEAGPEGLVLHPSNVDVAGLHFDDPSDVGDPQLDFGDDPNDPARNETEETSLRQNEIQNGRHRSAVYAGIPSLPALVNVNESSVISKARNYLGVRYEFGTGSYRSTHKFDCSTFTQFVFDAYGIDLPRTARAQAARGIRVDRKSLRKGDLLFFYVPGRFKSNRTVGHVGIYMGNNKMIHASPEPKNGVQITDINKAYWKRTFLYGKRYTK
ncbi:C40 family peptidase [Paenibacillus gansuensis]|uniref:NlpC/P60 family protein n=1 Tax=Paenibacillus gansuensis TaxID=306542 RepID=A0ABW5PDS4_9BACL